ncbi:GAF domain-containing protein [Adhaeribacter terreus]|uniref:GAF domain-containing protein n=1 Tax=Adhaeribacter terreus TaxID=529703 RepID=A0ABW0ECK4_9BACT
MTDPNTQTLEPGIETFPFKTVLSFLPIIEYWRAKTNEPSKALSLVARQIAKELKDAPELLEPIEDFAVLEHHYELVAQLMSAVFPAATFETETMGAITPLQDFSFYFSPKFSEIILTNDHELKQPLNMDTKTMHYYLTRLTYMLILEKFYHIPQPPREPLIYTIPDYKTGLYRHYNIELNSSFLKIQHLGDNLEITQETIQHLYDNINNMDMWMEVLPPEQFTLEGFYVMKLVDVTDQEVLSSLKYDLLQTDVMLAADRFEQLQEKIRVLFKRPNLQLGVTAFHKNRNTFVNFGNKINHSFLVQNIKDSNFSREFRAMYRQLIQENKPLVVKDVASSNLPEKIKKEILRLGINNIILVLLCFHNESIGILELGSPNSNDLDNFSLSKVEQFMPLFSVAVKRNAEEIENRVQAIIKERFTAIHPVLEWRFKEAALNLLEQNESGKQAEMEPIIFPEVYPLYGVSDIRGSSTERNNAIQEDLLEHLQLAENVLKKAQEFHDLPILDELKFFISKNLEKLQHGLLSEDEVSIFDSIKTEVEPLFEYLETLNPELKPVINAYWEAMDPKLGILYKRRKSFEESLTTLNDAISDLLDEEEEKAQGMFPHYFQKYKTDGVEHNIYIGESLVDGIPFDPIILKNMRLWQLMMMCKVSKKTALLKEDLQVSLDTTHLILIHAQPLSIRFRLDERQFDVDGAYNIRYEIIKKRIDKANIINSDERLTQPGKIAIVYSQAKEATEYLEYIDYLQNKGILEEEIENVEIEELQGVKGLQALRVKVKL